MGGVIREHADYGDPASSDNPPPPLPYSYPHSVTVRFYEDYVTGFGNRELFEKFTKNQIWQPFKCPQDSRT